MYDLIAANKRNSWVLVVLMVALMVAVGAAFGAYWNSARAGIVIAAVVAFFMVIVSYYGGRDIILGISGARKIEKKDAPQLYNVIEELTIASGLPMPDVYIIEDTAPNAFATGRNPHHAAVAITTGLLEKLNRDELQGVMAHELSHLKNFDIRFAMLMAVLVGTIALLCDFFWRNAFYGRRESRRGRGGGQAQALIILLALVLAILAPIVAKLIQLAVSRQREYLADASGAEMTRYPEGLASALEKIANDKEVLEVANRATQHLYIVNPIKPFEKRARALFSTHPPIEERIRRLRAIAHTA
jgi:heat shock protein HtpX